ncbi:recombinase family protein [Rhizobium indigoferae]|nr:recombinase family protein [Rhizobium indigoferae]
MGRIGTKRNRSRRRQVRCHICSAVFGSSGSAQSRKQRPPGAMRDRLAALGWSHIETVDDDLGRSAAGGVTRAGFNRMVAEVCLGKVGAVAAREVSRFARNSRDWQQLIEMCRVVDTVLVDQETVHAPRQGTSACSWV